jgi:hypothetical protein
MTTSSLPNYASGTPTGGKVDTTTQAYHDAVWADILSGGFSPTTTTAPAASINAVSTPPSITQQQVAAENAPLRVIYGQPCVGALIADALVYSGNLVIVAVWGEGEIDSVTQLYINNAIPASGVTAIHHTGTASQTVDATLVVAYAANGVAYTDTLAGVAYSVITIPAGSNSGFPSITAVIKGRKVYDPRTGLTVWSNNPALALADLMTSSTYGLGRSVDYTSVTLAANACDDTTPGEVRRILDLCLDNVSPTWQWIEALRTYAGCFILPGPNGLRLVPDRPAASVLSFTASSIVQGSLRLTKNGVQQVPTSIQVLFTDNTITPWAQRSAYAKLAGVDAGTTPRRESQVNLPGITRYSQAYREAVERLNKLNTADLVIQFNAFDESLSLEVGDVFDVTHPIGLSAKLFRCTQIVSGEAGRWSISGLEYDPAGYSDTVASGPSTPDTALPDPAAPPAVIGMTATEEVYQQQNGTYSSRLRVNWTAANYPYLDRNQITITAGGTVVFAGQAAATATTWASPSIQEGVAYTVNVQGITTIGAVGTAAVASLTAQGKQLPPGNVPWISAFEAGGTVHISWGAAVDIDIWRYLLKYGPVGGTWATATVLNTVDGLAYLTGDIPAGTWKLYIVAVDSVRNQSPTPTTTTVTVTLDANAYLVNKLYHTNPSISGMASFTLAPTDSAIYYATEDGILAATKFPGTASSYGNVAATYNATASSWVGESEDFGLTMSGTWGILGTATALSGTETSVVDTSPDNSAWTSQIGPNALATGRFARTRHSAASGSTMKVRLDSTSQGVTLNAVTRQQAGSGTSSASGPTTITVPINYAKATEVIVTPISPNAYIGVVDNIIVGTPTKFDAYVFNTAGTKVACAFNWSFKGVG